jgi:hypothetical protein
VPSGFCRDWQNVDTGHTHSEFSLFEHGLRASTAAEGPTLWFRGVEEKVIHPPSKGSSFIGKIGRFVAEDFLASLSLFKYVLFLIYNVQLVIVSLTLEIENFHPIQQIYCIKICVYNGKPYLSTKKQLNLWKK